MKKTICSLLTAAVLASGAFAATSAKAAPVTYDFAGTITGVYDDFPDGVPPSVPSFSPGTVFTGNITLDAESAVGVPDPSGSYYGGVIRSFNVTVADYEFTMINIPGDAVETVYNNRGATQADQIQLDAQNYNYGFRTEMFLGGTSFSNPLNSTDPVQDLPGLSDMHWGLSILFDTGSNGFKIYTGAVTSLTPRVSAVPIPAAAWLFGSGLLGLLGIACRRRLVA